MQGQITVKFKYPDGIVTQEQQDEFKTNLFLAMKSTTKPVTFSTTGQKTKIAMVKPYILDYKRNE